MSNNKRELGQFFTKKDTWLLPQIKEFIKSIPSKTCLDPFAGAGHLLNVMKDNFNYEISGLDIDSSLNWPINNSLLSIPKTNGLIITNPPWLAKNVAKRRKLNAYEYFEDNKFEDLYQLGLSRCLESADFVIAIIPETFLLSGLFTNRLHSISILENNPFDDTTTPSCIACFIKSPENCRIYKENQFIMLLSELNTILNNIKQKRGYKIKFNDPKGNIGLRAEDSGGDKRCAFYLPKDFDYPRSKIKVSSRHMTYLTVSLPKKIKKSVFVEEANRKLEEIRTLTQDIIMSPFMSNDKNGVRRRRLDFALARYIIEQTITRLNDKGNK